MAATDEGSVDLRVPHRFINHASTASEATMTMANARRNTTTRGRVTRSSSTAPDGSQPFVVSPSADRMMRRLIGSSRRAMSVPPSVPIIDRMIPQLLATLVAVLGAAGLLVLVLGAAASAMIDGEA